MGVDGFILEMENISKSFSNTRALKNVDFCVERGTVHALLGENGAGKSTLMKIVMGLSRADTGTMTFDGKRVVVQNPAQALSLGISMIHQELNPEPYLTVAENIFLGREPTKAGLPLLDGRRIHAETQKILDRFDFKVDPRRPVRDLTVAQMQMVEVIRAVHFNAKLIIMDEPTSSLDSEEAERLFQTIQELKANGVSVIYISHRMEEIFRICDAVSVFRDGEYIGTKSIGDVNRDQLISMMVGREVSSIFPKLAAPLGNVMLEVKNLSGGIFHSISFSVRQGEILGFSGLVGAGRSEMMRAICGLDRCTGQILFEGRAVRIHRPADAIRLGIVMVSEDRKEDGLVLNRSIRENISLPNLWHLQKGFFLDQKREALEVTKISKTLTVKSAGIEADAYSLSGGNQQKVVICKWIMESPKVMILDEPTRGIDVGAKAEIHRLMCEFAKQGMAIILISSELPEVMGMSDRILVISEGRISGEYLRDDIVAGTVTQEHILASSFA